MMSAMAHLPLGRLQTALSSAPAEGGEQFGLWVGRVGHLLWCPMTPAWRQDTYPRSREPDGNHGKVSVQFLGTLSVTAGEAVPDPLCAGHTAKESSSGRAGRGVASRL
jgi:hypothetical protein